MKKITTFLLLLSSIVLIATSCEEKTNIEKGKIESAVYNSTSQVFTIKYSNGQTEDIKAVINNSTVPPSASAQLNDGTIITVDNANESGDAYIYDKTKVGEFRYVNNWIQDEMSIYYLWNDKIPKAPDFSLKPNLFFESILYRYSASQPDGDRFSWIQDDYKELQQSLSGVASDEIGFEYIIVWADQAKTHYYPLVTYAKAGTDAAAKGVTRGKFITKVNGANITPQNIKTALGGTGNKTLSMAEWEYDKEDEKHYLTAIPDVTISMHKNFAENPVFLDSVYTIGDKKIGYLSYNFFATDNGDKSHDYDKLLMNRLNEIKAKGAKEMVLDLRYNSGGAVSTAIALASALVKNRSTNNILVTSQYNDIVHSALKSEYGADYNKEYFIDKIMRENVVVAEIPNLNLDRLFLLTGFYTASASELIINGLKPYMDVVLIGETTYGKNVGSITLYEKNDVKNKWGMQPIIVKYANSKGDSEYTAGFKPNHEIDEFDDLFLYPIGNTNDPLLGKAISLITGSTTKSATHLNLSETGLRSAKASDNMRLRNPAKLELQDDKHQDFIRKIGKQVK